MKAYEFPAKLTAEGTLKVPPDLLGNLPVDQTMRVIVLLDEVNGSVEDGDEDDENESPVEGLR